MLSRRARLRGVSAARAVVTHADGTRDFYYSVERVPWWQPRRRWQLANHLRFMREEDRKAGYGR